MPCSIWFKEGKFEYYTTATLKNRKNSRLLSPSVVLVGVVSLITFLKANFIKFVFFVMKCTESSVLLALWSADDATEVSSQV